MKGKKKKTHNKEKGMIAWILLYYYTIILDRPMDKGEDTWRYMVDEVHGFGSSFFQHVGAFLQIPKQKAIGVAGKSLLSQKTFKPLRPEPHPIQHPPYAIRYYYANRSNIH